MTGQIQQKQSFENSPRFGHFANQIAVTTSPRVGQNMRPTGNSQFHKSYSNNKLIKGTRKMSGEIIVNQNFYHHDYTI